MFNLEFFGFDFVKLNFAQKIFSLYLISLDLYYLYVSVKLIFLRHFKKNQKQNNNKKC